VPVNVTIGDGDVEETAAAAERAVDAGFDCLKLKVGARSVDADLDRVRRVRTVVSDDVTLRLDANGSWDRDEAREAFDALETLEVAYVEQPLATDELGGLADLRGSPVGVAVDETLATRSMAEVLEAGAADVVVLKPMALGGPGTAHTLALRARDAGVEPVVTTTVDAVVARTAAVHVAAAVPDVRPCGLATADRLSSDLAPDPAPVVDGSIEIPRSPGLGIDPAEVST
jgi:L-alanine-DL-glutamate epimerase-like enolase superfamily enzyme